MAGTHAEKLPVSHAPKVPSAPRPDRNGAILGGLVAAGTLAGVIVVVSFVDAANRLGQKPETRPEPAPVRPVDKKTMEYPYGTTINLFKDSSGELVMRFYGEPQILKAISFNVDEEKKVIFTDSSLDNPQKFKIDSESLVNDYFVPFFVDGDKPFPQAEDNQPSGDIWLMRVNVNGEPIGEDGLVLPEDASPIYTRIEFVNLDIPKAPQEPVLALT